MQMYGSGPETTCKIYLCQVGWRC